MRCILFSIVLLTTLTDAGIAQAQIRLPSAPRSTPQIGGLPEVRTSIRNTEINFDAGKLIDVRISWQRELMRKYPELVELDVAGAPVVRGQLVAIAPSAIALSAFVAAGFVINGERELPGLDTRLVILSPPAKLDLTAALARLRQIDATGTYDYNHIYSDSGTGMAPQTPASPLSSPSTRGGGAGRTVAVNDANKIGLIDGGVDRNHPALRDLRIEQWGCSGKLVASAHGNAVASIMAGHSGKFAGVLANASVYSADVYCGAPTGGATDAIVDALAWMAREHVGVINMSLVGPPNATLERILKIITARGHIVVAAVGNDGPSSPPLYPAAYAEVVAVTAVDSRQRILAEAVRGAHIAFAAPGSEMAAADDSGRFSVVRGTSFAAPIVAALLARELPAPDRNAAARAVTALAMSATDLGASGRDPVYGYGLVGMAYRNPVELAR